MFWAYDITSCDLSCDCGVTCLFIVQKKNKRKKKENQSEKIKENKIKIVSVQVSHNTEE